MEIFFAALWMILFFYAIKTFIYDKKVFSLLPSKKVFVHIFFTFLAATCFRISINTSYIQGNFYTWFLAPFWEEIARVALMKYPIVNSIIFSLAHFRDIDFLILIKLLSMYFFTSLVLNYILTVEKNIANTIICHVFINFFYFSYGFNNLLIEFIFFILGICISLVYIKFFLISKSNQNLPKL